MVSEELTFKAEQVEFYTEEFTPDFRVHAIHFAQGDPEEEGNHWNFSRSEPDDNEGVCTVKEIQQLTMYGGMNKFILERGKIICQFSEDAAFKTGFKTILIHFQIPEEKWEQLAEIARLVFYEENYFEVR